MEGDFQLGEWLVQPTLNQLTSRRATRRLEPKVMQVLVCLAAARGEVVPKERLIATVWADTFVTDDVVLRSISELRKALDDDAKDPRFIQTIPKSGYRLIAPLGVTKGAPARWRRFLTAGATAIGLAAIVLLWMAYRPGTRPPRQVMLAVLPFLDLGGDPEQEYFSDGLTDEMIAQLGAFHPAGLGVIARTSAMHYKGTRKRIDDIGRELKVDYVLEGTVRREGSKARVTARLIRVSDQAPLWASTYDREVGSIIATQQEIALAIARVVRTTFTGPSGRVPKPPRAVQAAAYEAYLKANYQRWKLTLDGFARAAELYQEAVKLDNSFAPAWLGLSDCYRMRGSWWGDMRPREAFPQALRALQHAMDLDPSVGDAHASLGWIHFVYDWDWKKAETEFRRAVELSPASRDALSPYGNFLRHMRRLEESRTVLERCLELDPLAPLELSEMSLVMVALDRPESAREYIRRAREAAPDFVPMAWLEAATLEQVGDIDQAIALLEKTAEVSRPERRTLGGLANLYYAKGNLKGMRRMLDRLLETPSVGQFEISRVYAMLGETENSLQWLEKAYVERDARLATLLTPTSSHLLSGHPRYRAVFERMNFPSR